MTVERQVDRLLSDWVWKKKMRAKKWYNGHYVNLCLKTHGYHANRLHPRHSVQRNPRAF